MKETEEAMRAYCPASLVSEFEKMSSADQDNLIDAFMSLVRTRMVNAVMRFESESGMQASHVLSPADRSCPLVRACVKYNMDPSELYEELLSNLRSQLATWGQADNNPSSQIARYRFSVQTSRQQYEMNANHVRTTSTAAIKRSESTSDWATLRRIRFRDLKLFQTSKKCYVEGKIVGEPIIPMTGGTTLIQEKEGDVLLVCFYNFLPDGISGAEADTPLKRELPMGATLRVAEPFYKIFGDGQRGVRVDNPQEMQVISDKNKTATDTMEAKTQGNKFVAQHKHNAAIETYLMGLRESDEIVSTLLSNRSQAFIKLEQWTLALCDSAASLTIRPNSTKTWDRYNLCLKAFKVGNDDDADKKRRIWKILLEEIAAQNPSSKDMEMEHVEALKASGNKSFQSQKYKEAIEYYTQALTAGGEIIRAMLSNWALCAMNLGIYGDVIASAAASLRIGKDEKAVYRLAQAFSSLGEYALAQQALSLLSSPSATVAKFGTEIQRAAKFTSVMSPDYTGDPAERISMIQKTPAAIGNYHGPVEIFMTSDGKGRGLRATENLYPGEIVLVEWPLVSSVGDKANKLYLSSDGKGNLNDFSATSIRSIVVNRLKRDSILNKVLSLLSNGDSAKQELVSIADMLVNIGMYPILLPCHREYFPNDTLERISADRVDRVLSINSHGIGWTAAGPSKTELYPTVSMMNHSSQPNCGYPGCTLDMLEIVTTNRAVAAGEELTVRYQTDDVVEKKWGIKPSSN